MDDILAKQLVRQLKIMNFWISVFGTMILVVLIILGVLVWKVVSFVNDTNKKIETLTSQTKETLDVKSKICDSEKLGNLLANRTDLCK